MRDDLRQAVRFLWRRRGVTALATAVLAVGIGATTFIFSVADAALFKPLPYRDPSRLVDFEEVLSRGTAEQSFQIGMPLEAALIWRSQSSLFEGVETYARNQPRVLTADPERTTIRTGHMSIGLLSLLGVSPRLGRGFLPAEGVDGRDRVILLSDATWKRRFGADRAVVGRSIQLDGVSYTVIGVMPPEFHFRPFQGDAWVPLIERPVREYVGTVARLRTGLSVDQANRQMPDAGRWVGEQLSRKRPLDVEVFAFDRHRSADQIHTTVILILGASAFLLLIACANVGNMLLALSVARRREIAVRRALGASRTRIVRQALAEGLLLSGLGAVGGLAFTGWAVRAAPALVPARLGLFEVHDLQVDARVLAFALGTAFITGVLASVATVTRRAEPAAAELQGRAGASTSPQGRTRAVLLAAQVALTFVLLIGAGLLAVSLVDVMHEAPGFDGSGLSYADVSLPERRYPTAAARDAFFDTTVERLRGIGGVAGVAQGTAPPSGSGGLFVAEGTEEQSRPLMGLEIHFIGADYFNVAGIPIRGGRALAASDSAAAAPVAVISEKAARTPWPDGQALGKRFRYSPYVPWITIVGIAGDVKTTGRSWGRSSVEVYLPYAQQKSPSSRTILVRAEPGRTDVAAAVRSTITSIDADAAPRTFGPVMDLYDDLYESPRFFASLMSLFAVVALLTAAIGLGGSLMYTVSRRTQEIGVRMALGADRWQVRFVVLRDAIGAVLWGLAAGLVASFWLGSLLTSMLYGVGSRDPRTIAGAAAVLLATAVIAAYLPAQRATRVDPMIALRAE